MGDLRALHNAARLSQDHAEECAAAFHRAVAQSLADGHSATEIARGLGVSRGRVYQWRDKAR